MQPPEEPDIGARQRIWEGVYLGRPAILKQRFSKRYRHPVLDTRLTQSRLRQVHA
jgi:TP53 regulating kinase-like protein